MRTESLELRLKALRLPSFIAHYAPRADKAVRAGWGMSNTSMSWLSWKPRSERTGVSTACSKRRSSRGTKRSPRSTAAASHRPSAAKWLVYPKGIFLRVRPISVSLGPGTGKTHIMAAIGHELVRQGHSVLFTPVAALVERLLEAKRDLRLTRELRRLDTIECLALDDIGYVQQDRSEMEVLFTLLAERYERKSVMLTSNLMFSQWENIFKDPMTTAAAIDRVVHHSVILELNVPSYRAETARQWSRGKPKVDTEEEVG